MSRRLVLVAGHGEMGGGEVMLLACADVLRELGLDPVVVAPAAPGTLAAAARAAGHPVVCHPTAPGAPWWRTAPAVRRAVRRARAGAPRVLVWCHGLRPAAATAGMRDRIVHVHRVPTRAQRPVLEAAALGARVVVVPSASARSLLPLRPRHRARVLGNWTPDLAGTNTLGGAPPEGAGPAAGQSFPEGGPTVGFLGRIAPEKGIEDLVAALEQRGEQSEGPAPVLRIGGAPLFVSPAEDAALHRVLAAMGDGVVRDGPVERGAFLSRVDVLVCPSRVPESFGLVAAEAMAAGVPVVVTGAGALPEVVGPEHPYTARPGDPRSLARVLHRALRELGTEAGDAVVGRARRRWEELWSPAAGRARVAELLTDLGVLA